MSLPAHNRRAWRRLTRKTSPEQPAELELVEVVAGLAGSIEQARVIVEAIDGDPARLPEVLPHLDSLPGVGAGTAYRFIAAWELVARAQDAAAP